MAQEAGQRAASFDWLVVGGGPCGIVSVAALLRRGQQVAWVDPDFSQVGRLGQRYQRVPGNTKTGKLLEGFHSLPALNFAASQAFRRAAGQQTLSDFSAEDTCELSFCMHALSDGSDALLANHAVRGIQGRVASLVGQGSSDWRAHVVRGSVGGPQDDDTICDVEARHVLLCTGGLPRAPPPQGVSEEIQMVEHDDVVAPDRLETLLERCPELRRARWGIVGGSHSGLLAAMNLVAEGVASISVFCSREVRFATPRDNNAWVKWDGSGLKGRVAAWARDLPPAVRLRGLWPEGGSGGEPLPQALVYCTGLERAPTPPTSWEGVPLDLARRPYDGGCGAIEGVPRLYGGGIGFPQEYCDPEGHTETRVGFVPFYIEHVDRMVEDAEAKASAAAARRGAESGVLAQGGANL